MLLCLLPDRQTLQVIKERCHLGYATLTFVYTFCSISLFLHDVHNYFPQYYMYVRYCQNNFRWTPLTFIGGIDKQKRL